MRPKRHILNVLLAHQRGKKLLQKLNSTTATRVSHAPGKTQFSINYPNEYTPHPVSTSSECMTSSWLVTQLTTWRPIMHKCTKCLCTISLLA